MRIKRHKKTETAEPHLNAQLFNRAESATAISRLEVAVWRAQENADWLARHGAVRILMRDGKPVESTESV